MPVPQLVNYRYTVVQLRPKRSLLHKNNIRELHACTSNEEFLVFSPSIYSVSILNSDTISMTSLCDDVGMTSEPAATGLARSPSHYVTVIEDSPLVSRDCQNLTRCRIILLMSWVACGLINRTSSMTMTSWHVDTKLQVYDLQMTKAADELQIL